MHPVLRVLAACCLGSCASHAAAQCTNPWRSFGGIAGTDGQILALAAWDPDGQGPLPPRLAAGGVFAAAGSTMANRVAAYDVATDTWTAFGSGILGSVNALAGMPNGDLVAAGAFTQAGGIACSNIARWDGNAWQPLGAGLNGLVSAAVVLANGDLVVTGSFTASGTTPLQAVARWNGSSWQALGSGLALPPYATMGHALTVAANGDVVVGGYFSQAGGTPAANAARWDGTAWWPLGSGLGGPVDALGALPNGDLVAAGSFTGQVARWNGAAWQPMSPLPPSVFRIVGIFVSTTGDILALCNGATQSANLLARWTGSAWTPLGAAFDSGANAVVGLPNGDVYVGGNFLHNGTTPGLWTPMRRLGRWDGSRWNACGQGGVDDLVHEVVALPGGDLVATGSFRSIGGQPLNHIGRWDGTAWHPLGSGISGTDLRAAVVLPGGDLVVGGWFSSAGGVAVQNVARWDGLAWHAMGSGLALNVLRLHVRPDGELLAGAGDGIHRWTGTSWQLWPGSPAAALTMANLPNGDLFAGCHSVIPAWRWNGTAWSILGNVLDGSVRCSAVTPSGELLIGGSFTTIVGRPVPYVARFDGFDWRPLGYGIAGDVLAMSLLPDGTPLIVGTFQQAPLLGIARLRGSTWEPFGSGIRPGASAVCVLADGDVVVGGPFEVVDGAVSSQLARITTTCPATSTTVATACVGPAGPLGLAATSLPWIGTTFRSRATGFAPNSLAAAVVGLAAQQLPLGPFGGLPSCDLLVRPDVAVFVPPVGGVAGHSIAVPPSTTLVGVLLHHQFLQATLGAGGGIASLSSSNALQLVVGAF